MKKVVSIVVIMALALTMCFSATAFAGSNITVKLDGKAMSFDVPPQIMNGRTMVPMRAIFENLGASVDWDNATKTVKSQKGSYAISMTIGKAEIVINGMSYGLDAAPCIVNGRTLVPVRAISEAFDMEVGWDNATKTVVINSGGAADLYINATSGEAAWITDFDLDYDHNAKVVIVSFVPRNGEGKAVKTEGTAKVSYKNNDGAVIYSKSVSVTNATYVNKDAEVAAQIKIPYSQLTNGKFEEGTISLDFTSKAGKTFDQQINSIWEYK